MEPDEEKLTPDQDSRCSEHGDDLLSGLHRLWKQRVLCDCVLLVGDTHISVQKVVLAACSRYFCELFTVSESVREVRLNGNITPEGLDPVMEFMYTSRIVLTPGNVKRILNTAIQLQMPRLVGLCATYIIGLVSVDNCVNILQYSSRHPSIQDVKEFHQLEEHTEDYIADHLVEVSEVESFQKLTAKELSQVLSQDRVGTTSEIQLFRIAAKWITHEPDRRLKHAAGIIRNIRFPLIGSRDLVDHVQSYDFMLEQSECHQFLLQALNYHLIPQRQHTLQTPRNRLRSSRDVPVIVGGELPNQKVSSDVLVFDESKSTWKHLTTLPLKRVDHSVAVWNDFMYVAGGQVTLNSNGKESIGTLHRYDPRLNSWLQMCPMQQRRAFFHLAVCGGTLYAIGGKNEQGALASAEVYDPTKNRWKFIANLNKPSYALAGGVLHGQVHISGGFSNRTFQKTFQVYDSQLDRWHTKRPLCNARGFHMMCTLRDNIYVMGGNQQNPMGERVDVSSMERYSPEVDEWITISPMLAGLSMSGITTIDDARIFVVGGYNGQGRQRERDVHAYNVEKDEWDVLGELPASSLRMAACTLVLPRSVFRDGNTQNSWTIDSSALSGSQTSLSLSASSTPWS